MKLASNKECIHEESILKYIDSQRLGINVNVPAIYSSLNGIVANCKYHNAFFMQYIRGAELSRINIKDNAINRDDG